MTPEGERYLLFCLTYMHEILPGKLWKALETCGDIETLFAAEEEDPIFAGFTEREKGIFFREKANPHMEEDWEKNRHRFLTYKQEGYPKQLLDLFDSPFGIYYKGRTAPISPSVAIVGARASTVYGKELAYGIAKELASRGVTIISGLAAGIDGASHRGALDGGGYTMAFLGTDIDQVYPKEHFSLYRQMEERGCMFSEYPARTNSLPAHFPRRNRLISVCADYVLVVEARKKSGSLITVDYALEQGKCVGAVPGRPCDPLSEGCNHLIRQGADPVLDAEDVLESLGVFEQKGDDAGQVRNVAAVLESKERLVYELIGNSPTFADDILVGANLSMGDVFTALSGLEAKGLVRQEPHLYYHRTHKKTSCVMK